MVFIYTLASVLSAFLVFFIQPIVAKIALPTLGGTPMVWNGCMVFFQAALLSGYAYAHMLGRIKINRQPWWHLSLMIIAVASFPARFDGAASIDPTYSPLLWLMLTLFCAAGLPFFVISASSPLLQKWFSNTSHPKAHHPYFLYAASNIGSMGALVAYPILVEPHYTLAQQVKLWEWGIGLLFLLFGAAAWLLWGQKRQAIDHRQQVKEEKPNISWGQRKQWIMLAFVPSSLLYGVTSYITTDLVSAPMLWLLPLVIYLITFILMFERNMRGAKLADRFQMPLVFFAVLMTTLPGSQSAIFLIVHLLAFFASAMVLHGHLSLTKPAPAHLTEFFMWMSLGGVLGGMFNTFLAPHLFNSIVEYPLMLLLSCAMRLDGQEIVLQLRASALKVLAWCVPMLLFICGVWVLLGKGHEIYFYTIAAAPMSALFAVRIAALACAAIFAAKFDKQPAAWALGLGLLASGASAVFLEINMGNGIYQERSVFGVNRVLEVTDNTHIFMHGTTVHGVQSSGAQRLQPNAYYWILKDVFSSLDPALRTTPVAVMGLGAGTVACHGKIGQEFDFFEIDPVIAKIASNPKYFTYLQDCPPEKKIILGDARRQVQNQPDARYGLMVIDTFSSDAIPVHIITQEAVALYLTKLKDKGMLAFNVSNQHIELRPVLSAIANKLGLAAIYRDPVVENQGPWVHPSTWVVLARTPEILQPVLNLHDGWRRLPPDPDYLWTDDFSNIFFSLIPVRHILGKDLIGESNSGSNKDER